MAPLPYPATSVATPTKAAEDAILDGVIRVLIVDDHPVFGASLARTLADEPDIEVVAAVGTESEALETLSSGVDVLLTGFRLPTGSGIELARKVSARWPGVKVVMLTASHDDTVLAEALKAGCAGFVTKSESLATVLAAIRAAAAGESVITPTLLARLLPRIAQPTGHNPDLTPREEQVLRLIVRGGTNQEIADSLHLSRDTVRNHVASILAKLGVHSKLQAAAAAVERGLVSPPEP